MEKMNETHNVWDVIKPETEPGEEEKRLLLIEDPEDDMSFDVKENRQEAYKYNSPWDKYAREQQKMYEEQAKPAVEAGAKAEAKRQEEADSKEAVRKEAYARTRDERMEGARRAAQAGWSKESIEHEWGQGGQEATDPGWYDPIDLVIDIATGGLTAPGRVGIKTIIKGVKSKSDDAVRAGLKMLGKNVALDVGFGAMAGTIMEFVDEAGAGQAVTMLSGLIGTTLTSAMLTMTRKGLAQFMKNLAKTNKDTYDDILSVVNKKEFKDLTISKVLRDETGAIEFGGPKKPKDPDAKSKISIDKEENIIFKNKEGDEVIYSPVGKRKVLYGKYDAKEATALDAKLRNLDMEWGDLSAKQQQLLGKYYDRVPTGASDVGKVEIAKDKEVLDRYFKIDTGEETYSVLGTKSKKVFTRNYIEGDKDFRSVAAIRRVEDINTRVAPDKKPINIRFENMNESKMIADAVSKTGKVYTKNMDEAQLAKFGKEQKDALAKELDIKPDELPKDMSSASAVGSRVVIIESAEKLHRLAQLATSEIALPVHKFAFIQHLAKHSIIVNQVKGVPMGMNPDEMMKKFDLSQFKTSSAKINRMMQIVDDESMQKGVNKVMKIVAETDTINSLNSAAGKLHKVKFSDQFYGVWVNGLLTGPQTHAVNITSNAFTTAWSTVERLGAAGMSQVIGSGQVKGGEALYQLYGFANGIGDAFRLAGRAAATGQAQFGPDKIRSFKGSVVNFKKELSDIKRMWNDGNSVSAAMHLLYLTTIKFPFQSGAMLALRSADDFFKVLNYRMELHAQAYRRAVEEGLTGNDLKLFVEKITKNPETYAPDLHLNAMDTALTNTFTKPLGKTGRGFQTVVNNTPGLKYIFPFVTTPANIVKFAGERTPYGFLKALGMKSGAEKDLMLAKATLGSMAMATTAGFVLNGTITGAGPKDPKIRNLMREAGWQPYSIRVGDSYYSYNRLEPFGIVIGMAADITELVSSIDKDLSEEVEFEIESLIVGSIMLFTKNIASKTWLRGFIEMVNAVSNPDWYGERWVQKLIGSVSPGWLTTVERFTDPELREVNRIWENLQSRVPGWSSSLPPRRNIFGEKITLSGSFGPDWLSPIYSSDRDLEPIIKEQWRLGYPIPKPRKSQNFNGIDIELNPKQYDDLIVTMNEIKLRKNRNYKQELTYLVTKDPMYKKMNDEQKINMITTIKQAALSMAKAVMMQKDRELKETFTQQLKQKQEEYSNSGR